MIASYISVKYIWTSWFCKVYHIFKSAIIKQTTSTCRERGSLRVPKMLKSRSLALRGLRPLDLVKTLATLRYQVYAKKILKIKIPFQILFYPFRCMFKIMKGYINFDFTPSGKSLKKTLVHAPFIFAETGVHLSYLLQRQGAWLCVDAQMQPLFFLRSVCSPVENSWIHPWLSIN